VEMIEEDLIIEIIEIIEEDMIMIEIKIKLHCLFCLNDLYNRYII
jgi:hypothetical protein